MSEAIYWWVERLWRIETARLEEAQAKIDAWGIPRVARALAPTTADGVIAAFLLVEACDELVARGVPESKLRSKLRADRDVWPTWAEIRCAGLLARLSPSEVRLAAERDRVRGAHVDFSVEFESGECHAIEFKAVGLSDAESAFAAAMEPVADGLVPREGIVTMHVHDTELRPHFNRATRRAYRIRGERAAQNLPPVARGIAAAVVVGHGTEENYVRRLQFRFRDAFRQFPIEEQTWVAFHWSNGAPIELIRRAISGIEVPDNLAGLVVLGSVAILGSFDNYFVLLPAPFDREGGDEEWSSDTSVEGAQALLRAVERSGGVRPTVVNVPYRDRRYEFIRRTTTQRILPFNLVLEPDPPEYLPHAGARRITSD